MTKDEMARLQDEIFRYCQGLREAGQKEYAHDSSNAFRNFEAEAAKAQVDRKAALMIYFDKHIDGIWSAVRGHKSQREPVYGRICDAIVYLTLLYGMFLEDDKATMQENPVVQARVYLTPEQVQEQFEPEAPDYQGGGLIAMLKEEQMPRSDQQMMDEYDKNSPVDISSYLKP